MEHADYLKRMWRASLSASAVLTMKEAVEALPCDPAVAEAWLRRCVAPTGHVAGVSVYQWAEVLRAIERPTASLMASQVSPPGNPPVHKGEDAFLSTTAAARFASVTPKTIRTWVQQGRLKVFRAGRLLRFRRQELVDLMGGGAVNERSSDDVAKTVLARLRANV